MALPRTTIYWGTGTGALGLSRSLVRGMRKMGIERTLFGVYVYEDNIANMTDSPAMKELGKLYQGPSIDRINTAYGYGGSRDRADLASEQRDPILSEMVEKAISAAHAAHLDEIFEIVALTPESAGHYAALEELILKRNMRRHLGATRIGLAILPEEADKRRRLADHPNSLLKLVDERTVDIVIILDNNSPYAQMVGDWHNQDIYSMEVFSALLAGIFTNTSYRSGVDIATTLRRQMSLTCLGIAHMPVSPIEQSLLQRAGNVLKRGINSWRPPLNPNDVVNSAVEGFKLAINNPNHRTLGETTPYDTNIVTYGTTIIPIYPDDPQLDTIETRIKRATRALWPNLEIVVIPGEPTPPPNVMTGSFVVSAVILPMPDRPEIIKNIETQQALVEVDRSQRDRAS